MNENVKKKLLEIQIKVSLNISFRLYQIEVSKKITLIITFI